MKVKRNQKGEVIALDFRDGIPTLEEFDTAAIELQVAGRRARKGRGGKTNPPPRFAGEEVSETFPWDLNN